MVLPPILYVADLVNLTESSSGEYPKVCVNLQTDVR